MVVGQREIERELRDTLTTVSLKLLATLIKHYPKIVEEKKLLKKQYLKKLQRDTYAKLWK